MPGVAKRHNSGRFRPGGRNSCSGHIMAMPLEIASLAASGDDRHAARGGGGRGPADPAAARPDRHAAQRRAGLEPPAAPRVPPDRLRRARPRRVGPRPAPRRVRVRRPRAGSRVRARRARPRAARARRELDGGRDRDGLRARAPRQRLPRSCRSPPPTTARRAPATTSSRPGSGWPTASRRGGIDGFVAAAGLEKPARALARGRPARHPPADRPQPRPSGGGRRDPGRAALTRLRRPGAARGPRRARRSWSPPATRPTRCTRSRSPRNTPSGCRAGSWSWRTRARRRWPGREPACRGLSETSSIASSRAGGEARTCALPPRRSEAAPLPRRSACARRRSARRPRRDSRSRTRAELRPSAIANRPAAIAGLPAASPAGPCRCSDHCAPDGGLAGGRCRGGSPATARAGATSQSFTTAAGQCVTPGVTGRTTSRMQSTRSSAVGSAAMIAVDVPVEQLLVDVGGLALAREPDVHRVALGVGALDELGVGHARRRRR